MNPKRHNFNVMENKMFVKNKKKVKKNKIIGNKIKEMLLKLIK